MKKATLFILTDAWDHLAGRGTAKNSKLEWAEMAFCFQGRRPAASRSFCACSIIPRLVVSVAK
jgi:hypothetical protein